MQSVWEYLYGIGTYISYQFVHTEQGFKASICDEDIALI